eukprot:1374593-Amorphochlora_amoeboformis.AAC.1
MLRSPEITAKAARAPHHALPAIVEICWRVSDESLSESRGLLNIFGYPESNCPVGSVGSFVMAVRAPGARSAAYCVTLGFILAISTNYGEDLNFRGTDTEKEGGRGGKRRSLTTPLARSWENFEKIRFRGVRGASGGGGGAGGKPVRSRKIWKKMIEEQFHCSP